ncbi:LytR/AlgR family response regulator transcription factor [Lacihabitans soyangensis]|nr:LytTR family transcriptional regulator DNA-binding domain-containing protein [Lacihabitans soyangensis]
MSKKQVVILDDDPLYLLKLEVILEDSNFNIIGSFDNVEDTKAFLAENENKVDIFISDLFIGSKVLGCDLIHDISPAPFPILCITSSYDENLHLNLKELVSYYLIKPFHKITLIDCLNRAINLFEEKRLHEFISNRYILISVKPGVLCKINFVDVIYLESSENYTYFYTKHGKFAKKLSLSRLLSDFLDDRFIRIHSKFAVNSAHISAVSTKEVNLKTNLMLPVSRGFRENIKDFMIQKEKYPTRILSTYTIE